MTKSTTTLLLGDTSYAENVAAYTDNVTVNAARISRLKAPSKRKIEAAVWAYIRAIRALGHRRVNTVEIANALSVSVDEVNRAIGSLRRKGVRVAR